MSKRSFRTVCHAVDLNANFPAKGFECSRVEHIVVEITFKPSLSSSFSVAMLATRDIKGGGGGGELTRGSINVTVQVGQKTMYSQQSYVNETRIHNFPTLRFYFTL